jgi:hypothetical protein
MREIFIPLLCGVRPFGLTLFQSKVKKEEKVKKSAKIA